jgi:hypothetical protein
MFRRIEDHREAVGNVPFDRRETSAEIVPLPQHHVAK